jgi:hypothetical protein
MQEPRDTPLLFPADLREWLPEDQLVHFIIEAVEQLDVSPFKVNGSGKGETGKREVEKIQGSSLQFGGQVL